MTSKDLTTAAVMGWVMNYATAEDLTALWAAVKVRRESLALKATREIEPGTKCTLAGLKPKYIMEGTLVEVVGPASTSKMKCKIIREPLHINARTRYGFREGATVRVPSGCLRPLLGR